ncbi:hypothetical protein AGIG_G16267 [Arapaima gigas]
MDDRGRVAPSARPRTIGRPLERPAANGRAPTTSLPPSRGRASRAPIGGKLLWERKFGKFHTSRSRAVANINRRRSRPRRTLRTAVDRLFNAVPVAKPPGHSGFPPSLLRHTAAPSAPSRLWRTPAPGFAKPPL